MSVIKFGTALSAAMILALYAGCSPPESSASIAARLDAADRGDSMAVIIGKNGWQGSEVLTTGNVDRFLQFQANFEKPGAYTVQFAVTPPDFQTNFAAPGFGIYTAIAEISWRVEGGDVRRVVSVANGVSVSGVGQGVKVAIRDTTTFGAPPRDYTVFAQVAPGTRPSVQQPPTLLGFPTFQTINAGGGTATINIPANAGVISSEVSIGPVAIAGFPVIGVLVIQKNGGGQILKEYDPTVESGFVPVAPGCTQIDIVNQNAANNYRIQVTFGIDG